MHLLLTREPSDGMSVRGTLSFSKQSGAPSYRLGDIKTLENRQYLIPPGTYPLTVTYSPRFKRPLPLLCNVPGRSGIRFHRGSKPEHSKGCILLRTTSEVDHLTALLQQAGSATLTIRDAADE